MSGFCATNSWITGSYHSMAFHPVKMRDGAASAGVVADSDPVDVVAGTVAGAQAVSRPMPDATAARRINSRRVTRFVRRDTFSAPLGSTEW